MLANPARELLRVFEGWSQSSSSVARFARPLDTEEEIAQARFRADGELESASCKRRLYDGNCFFDRDMHRGAITVFCVEGEVLNDVVHFLDGFVGAEPWAGGPLGFGGVHWCFLSWRRGCWSGAWILRRAL